MVAIETAISGYVKNIEKPIRLRGDFIIYKVYKGGVLTSLERHQRISV
jgi:hypothetical protein